MASITLAILYAYVIYKVLRGSKFTLIIKLTAALLVGAISTLLYTFYEVTYNESQNNETLAIYPFYVFFFVSESTFNGAHWTFAYKYFEASVQIKYIKNEQKLP
jgi:hypothetical protein